MKKLLFLILVVIAIILSPYAFPLKLKKALVQSKLQNIPGTFTFEDIQINPFSGFLFTGVSWKHKDTVIKFPSANVKASFYSFFITKEADLKLSSGKLFYKDALLLSYIESFLDLEFRNNILALSSKCKLTTKIHKSGTEKLSGNSIIPPFSGTICTLSLDSGSIAKSGFPSLNMKGSLDLNKLNCSKNHLLTVILNLLKQSPSKDIKVECGKINFTTKDGITAFDKTHFLIDNSYDIVSKGAFDFVSKKLNILVGLTTSSLIQAFDFSHLPEGYIIPFKISGSLDEPKIHSKDAIKAIAALLLLKKIDPERRHYPKVQPF